MKRDRELQSIGNNIGSKAAKGLERRKSACGIGYIEEFTYHLGLLNEPFDL